MDSCVRELVLSRLSQATVGQAGSGSSLEISLNKFLAELRLSTLKEGLLVSCIWFNLNLMAGLTAEALSATF